MTERVLEGTVAAVSGASRGIGRYLAELLAGHGASLALCARSERDLVELATRLEADHGVKVHAAPADVCDRHAVIAFAEEALRSLGPADVVINNAGALGPVGPVGDVDADLWEHAFRVNLIGTVNLTSAFLGPMVERRRGSIVNLSGGGVGGPNVPSRISAYTTSKAAVVALTEALARELEPHGVRANAVAPGAAPTSFMDPVLGAGPERGGEHLYETTRRQREEPDLLERFGELVLYLASDESAWLTGRLLSARWETVEYLRSRRERISGTSLFTMRRIDDVLYVEARPEEGPDG